MSRGLQVVYTTLEVAASSHYRPQAIKTLQTMIPDLSRREAIQTFRDLEKVAISCSSRIFKARNCTALASDKPLLGSVNQFICLLLLFYWQSNIYVQAWTRYILYDGKLVTQAFSHSCLVFYIFMHGTFFVLLYSSSVKNGILSIGIICICQHAWALHAWSCICSIKHFVAVVHVYKHACVYFSNTQM